MRHLFNQSSLTGRLLFSAAVMIAFSGNLDFRIPLAGVFIHPYLFVFIPLTLVIISERRNSLPPVFYLLSAAFLVLVFISMSRYFFHKGEMLKLVTTFSTLAISALAIKNRADVYLCFVGICIAVFFFTVLGTLDNEATLAGMQFTKGLGNKNAYSLYSIPAFFLALSYFSLGKRSINIESFLVLCCMLLLTWAILVSGNRSGWIGYVLAFALLFFRKRQKIRFVVVGLMVFAAIYVFSAETTSRMVAHKAQRSTQMYAGDVTRWKILESAGEIIIDAPLIGLSPRGLALELGYKVKGRNGYDLDPHNVFLYLLGAYGVPATLVFFGLIYAIVRPRSALKGRPDTLMVWDYVRLLVILWLVRGIFTREILAAPAFIVSIGAAWGGALHERNAVDRFIRLAYIRYKQSAKKSCATTATQEQLARSYHSDGATT